MLINCNKKVFPFYCCLLSTAFFHNRIRGLVGISASVVVIVMNDNGPLVIHTVEHAYQNADKGRASQGAPHQYRQGVVGRRATAANIATTAIIQKGGIHSVDDSGLDVHFPSPPTLYSRGLHSAYDGAWVSRGNSNIQGSHSTHRYLGTWKQRLDLVRSRAPHHKAHG